MLNALWRAAHSLLLSASHAPRGVVTVSVTTRGPRLESAYFFLAVFFLAAFLAVFFLAAFFLATLTSS